MMAGEYPNRPLLDEIHRLVVARDERSISPQDEARLQQMVADDPHARRVFVQYMLESASLRAWAHAQVDNPTDSDSTANDHDVPPETDDHRVGLSLRQRARGWAQELADRRPSTVSMTAAALVVGVGLIALAMWTLPTRESDTLHRPLAQPSPETGQFIAKITGMRDCQWDPAMSPIHMGSHLRPDQELRLIEGLAHLTFDDGTRVILEGPTTFRVTSRSSGAVEVGRLTAAMPRGAKGFTVEVPNSSIVDLGTEFGVAVDASGDTDLSIFGGAVEIAFAESAGKPLERTRLEAGKSARIVTRNGSTHVDVQDRAPGTGRFVRTMPPPPQRIGLHGEQVRGYPGDSAKELVVVHNFPMPAAGAVTHVETVDDADAIAELADVLILRPTDGGKWQVVHRIGLPDDESREWRGGGYRSYRLPEPLDVRAGDVFAHIHRGGTSGGIPYRDGSVSRPGQSRYQLGVPGGQLTAGEVFTFQGAAQARHYGIQVKFQGDETTPDATK